MSKQGINIGFAKCFILFMGLIILLQGAIYLALSLWGLFLSNCTNQNLSLLSKGDIAENPFRYMVDITYFKNKNCGALNIEQDGVNFTITTDWEKSEIVTSREFKFFISYAVVSAAWVLSSLLVIGSICGRLTICSSIVCFWPWFFCVLAGCALDVVATVYHVMDIMHMATTTEALDYVGFNNLPNDLMTIFTDYDSYLVVPSIVMTAISSRVALLWLLNMFGSIFCISLVQTILKNNKESKNEIIANVVRNGNERQSLPPVQQQQQQQSQQPSLENLRMPTPPVAAPPQNPSITEQTNQPSTYRYTDAHPDRLNYPPSPLPVSPLSIVSPLNNRYSSMEAMQQNQSPVRVSAELRSQLPWSYTNAQQQQQQPRTPNDFIYPELRPDSLNRS